MLLSSIVPVEREPLVPDAENPGPVTLQLLTLVADQMIVDELPERISVGFEIIVRSEEITVTVHEFCPPFEQNTVYVVVSDGVISTEPDTTPPVEKFSSPVELVESIHDHEIVRIVTRPTLNDKTRKILDRELKEIKEGKNISPRFDNAKDAIAYLKAL